MGQKRRFGILGGDGRQAALGSLLARDGHEVVLWGLDRIETPLPRAAEIADLTAAEVIVLPLPALGADGGINLPFAASGERYSPGKVCAALRPAQVIFTGGLPEALAKAAEARGLTLADYAAREEFAVANAVPTAEGAIAAAMEALPVTLCGQAALVIGYGRLGRALAPRLRALGMDVAVAARRHAPLAWARAEGLSTLHTDALQDALGRFRIIVNTAPALLLTAPLLREVRGDAVCIDLSSRPGGIDFDAAEALGVRTVHALGLPGKVAPESAALAVRDTIYHCLEEMEP
ncbi:MAG TPA: dipicolinate synthase subunit DpsA [Oscillospiraceae bacterium]|nr:dipicolinate synthase subunit DpsA [Oscillospiraceae bacterium]